MATEKSTFVPLKKLLVNKVLEIIIQSTSFTRVDLTIPYSEGHYGKIKSFNIENIPHSEKITAVYYQKSTKYVDPTKIVLEERKGDAGNTLGTYAFELSEYKFGQQREVFYLVTIEKD